MILNFDDKNIQEIKEATKLKQLVADNAIELITYYAKDILLNKPKDDLAYLSFAKDAGKVIPVFQKVLDARDMDSRMVALFDCEPQEPYYKDKINNFIKTSGQLSNETEIQWKNVQDINDYYYETFNSSMNTTRFNELEENYQKMLYQTLKFNIEMFSYFFINLNDAFINKNIHTIALDFENNNIICLDEDKNTIKSPIDISFLNTLTFLNDISNGGLKLKYIQKQFTHSQFEAFCEYNLRIKDELKEIIVSNYEKNVLFSEFPSSFEKSLTKKSRM